MYFLMIKLLHRIYSSHCELFERIIVMDNLHEDLLSAWLQLSTSINNTRVVSELTYNESLICNILYNNSKHNSDRKLTATDLCSATKMLKSQMNRTLNQLEKRMRKVLSSTAQSVLDSPEFKVMMHSIAEDFGVDY